MPEWKAAGWPGASQSAQHLGAPGDGNRERNPHRDHRGKSVNPPLSRRTSLPEKWSTGQASTAPRPPPADEKDARQIANRVAGLARAVHIVAEARGESTGDMALVNGRAALVRMGRNAII